MIIIPILCISILILIFSFFPMPSIDKITLSITILFCIVVYQLILTQNLPASLKETNTE